MVPITTVSQPAEATPLQVLLGSHGIKSQLDGDYTVAANPLLSNAVGGIQLMVSETNAKHATDILAEYRRAEAEEEAIRARTCPKCGCQNGDLIKRPLIFAILAIVTLGAFCLLYPWPKYKCPDCGHKWR